MNREAWLGRLLEELRPRFCQLGFPLPERIRVACGWPSRSALSGKARRVGEAWSARCSADGTCETFLSPALSDWLEVGAVLLHELTHHAVGVDQGHNTAFKRCALAVGLVGPMRSTTAGPELLHRLSEIIEKIGPYPHASLAVGSQQSDHQSTRLLKVQCACGCVLRMTRHWISKVGLPTCGCGSRMTEAT